MSKADGWHALFAAPLRTADSEVAGLLLAEEQRQKTAVNLIAFESYCPQATVDAEASSLVNKNATGYPGRRDVAGCMVVDQVERLAVERAKRLFRDDHANVQALSSTVANIAVLRALLRPGDRILALDRVPACDRLSRLARHRGVDRCPAVRRHCARRRASREPDAVRRSGNHLHAQDTLRPHQVEAGTRGSGRRHPLSGAPGWTRA